MDRTRSLLDVIYTQQNPAMLDKSTACRVPRKEWADFLRLDNCEKTIWSLAASRDERRDCVRARGTRWVAGAAAK